jgi:hypothetical protein
MLLEESLLYLLRHSGYVVVTAPDNDPMLGQTSSGLTVRGRGEQHQADALADSSVVFPFSFPVRLFVEAKCYQSSKVGIATVRNAVGVLKDVREFWTPPQGTRNRRPIKRYAYQYALFSATTFSAPAQKYAYAQEIFLIALDKARYFQDVLRSIRQIANFEWRNANESNSRKLSRLRTVVRTQLLGIPLGTFDTLDDLVSLEPAGLVTSVLRSVQKLGFGLLVTFGGEFVTFLSPVEDLRPYELEDEYVVRIQFTDEAWLLLDSRGRPLFSFDLPEELFRLYQRDGTLSPRRAIQLKGEFMDEFQSVFRDQEGRVRVIQFKIDRDWLGQVSRDIEERRERRR